jgi:hypothetical protein
MITAPLNPAFRDDDSTLACAAGTPSVLGAAARLNDSAEPGAGPRSGPPLEVADERNTVATKK